MNRNAGLAISLGTLIIISAIVAANARGDGPANGHARAEGIVLGSDGKPYSKLSAENMQFQLHDAVGDVLWIQNFERVSLTTGKFDVTLGDKQYPVPQVQPGWYLTVTVDHLLPQYVSLAQPASAAAPPPLTQAVGEAPGPLLAQAMDGSPAQLPAPPNDTLSTPTPTPSAPPTDGCITEAEGPVCGSGTSQAVLKQAWANYDRPTNGDQGKTKPKAVADYDNLVEQRTPAVRGKRSTPAAAAPDPNAPTPTPMPNPIFVRRSEQLQSITANDTYTIQAGPMFTRRYGINWFAVGVLNRTTTVPTVSQDTDGTWHLARAKSSPQFLNHAVRAAHEGELKDWAKSHDFLTNMFNNANWTLGFSVNQVGTSTISGATSSNEAYFLGGTFPVNPKVSFDLGAIILPSSGGYAAKPTFGITLDNSLITQAFGSDNQ